MATGDSGVRQRLRIGSRRGEDGDGAERMEDEQVLIAGDDVRGVSGDGEFEEFVVERIAAGLNCFADRDFHGTGQSPRQEFFPEADCHISLEFWLADHANQFQLDFIAHEQNRIRINPVENAPGNRLGKDCGTHADVGVNDDVHRPTP